MKVGQKKISLRKGDYAG